MKQLVYVIVETQEPVEDYRNFIVRDAYFKKEDVEKEVKRLKKTSDRFGSKFSFYEREIK